MTVTHGLPNAKVLLVGGHWGWSAFVCFDAIRSNTHDPFQVVKATNQLFAVSLRDPTFGWMHNIRTNNMNWRILIQLPFLLFVSLALTNVKFDSSVITVQTLRADRLDSQPMDLPKAEQPSTCASTLPLPSSMPSMPLADYEKLLFEWLFDRQYAELAENNDAWAVDKRVRDTGPFVNGTYYGVHPAVRIYYSPEVKTWLENGREGPVADCGIIIKEMFKPPAAIYAELERVDPEGYDALLETLVTGWTVMIKDRKGSKDGWFWAGPGAPGTTFLGNRQTNAEAISANVDDYSHVLYSGFGLYTCMRCHASAEREFTFATTDNIDGFPGEPLQFHVDNSWRDEEYVGGLLASLLPHIPDDSDNPDNPNAIREMLQLLLALPEAQLPYGERLLRELTQHGPPPPSDPAVSASPLMAPNPDFLAAFSEFTAPDGETKLALSPVPRASVQAFPFQWSDHVFPGWEGPGDTNTSPHEFITSDTCIGCHGGLGGAPNPTMFVVTGPAYGDGFNVSPYGEWRWSPMGLAGRDPIFHAQLESEMIMMAKNDNALTFSGSTLDQNNPISGTLEANQKALINTCLSCHGAMGQRQLHIDAAEGRPLPNDHPLDVDFNPDYFYLTEPLTQDEVANPPQPSSDSPDPSFDYSNPDDFASYHSYGELAREGISCTVCHRATAVDDEKATAWTAQQDLSWLPLPGMELWSDNFFYFLANNTTGQFERSPANQINGPFKNVTTYPMENALGITPQQNEFTTSSEMCGSCHVINLPNIGNLPDWVDSPPEETRSSRPSKRIPPSNRTTTASNRTPIWSGSTATLAPARKTMTARPIPTSRAVKIATCRAVFRCRGRVSTFRS
ncbi:hypothetical protein KFU94_70615 [Chloroflexi bacterium TSY]|nr:hypothetical protein [Chloroflexi bacterium TSY]